MKNPYDGDCIILATKHAKSISISPVLWDKLNASVMEFVLHTDALGTFTGEIERVGSSLDCARKKCQWAADLLGPVGEFILASEGSFGPHPIFPLIPCDEEILYFMDKRHGFELHVSILSEFTNYNMAAVESYEALQDFAVAANFPSHSLIVRPSNRQTLSPLFKGIDSWADLEDAYNETKKSAADGKVWVETDMRAQFNPSRMTVIGQLAANLADRLSRRCPCCGTPGWGSIDIEKGLPCSWCGTKTSLVKYETYGCTKCTYQERCFPRGEPREADPLYCQLCNP